MREELKLETAKLARSWDQYDHAMLRDYLVRSVEDPRLNVQSVLTRHFLIEMLWGESFAELKEEELRFATAMNWLLTLRRKRLDAEERAILDYALNKGADNAEGFEIPEYISKIYQRLPVSGPGWTIPNYVADELRAEPAASETADLSSDTLGLFLRLWRNRLAPEKAGTLRVLEPACGSANDYRFLEAAGIAQFLDYQGLDLSEKNIANARQMFPHAHWDVGNVFELPWRDAEFDAVFVHDLFEHLSPAALEVSVDEVCRVARLGICIGFFNMDELPDHQIQPVDDYHWNRLSMDRMRRLFESRGWSVQVIHIGSFLDWAFGCRETHNPNAYTFFARRTGGPETAAGTR